MLCLHFRATIPASPNFNFFVSYSFSTPTFLAQSLSLLIGPAILPLNFSLNLILN